MNANTNIVNLENLIDLSSILLNSSDEKYIIDTILLSIMGKFGIKRGIVFYQVSQNSNFYKIFTYRGKSPFSLANPHIPLAEISAENPFIHNYYDNKFEFQTDQNKNIIFYLSSKINNDKFSKEEYTYLHLVSKIAQSALKNANNNVQLEETKQSLERRNQILSTLFEISRDYSIVDSYDEIFRMFSLRLMGQLMISKFSMAYIDDNKEIKQCIYRFSNSLSVHLLHSLNNSLHSTTSSMDFNISSEKLINEINLNDIQYYIPMYHNNVKKGFILLGKKMNNQEISQDNINFVEALASATISTMENHLLINELIEKKNIENQLNLAFEIQHNLLPKSELIYKNFSLAGVSIPSQQIGGDYFDYFILTDENIIFTVADVSGKGLPASLLMANVQAAFKALTLVEFNLLDLLNNLNKIVYRNTSPEKFVTMFIGIINTNENKLTYINAGHNPPILFKRNGYTEELKEGGLFLGIFDEDINYSLGEVTLEANDLICLFTDGISETPNLKGEEYGNQRIINIINKNIENPATEIINNTLDSVAKFSETELPYDDQTILIIKILK